MMLVFSCLLLSCGKEDDMNGIFDLHDYRIQDALYPKGARLKRVFIGGGLNGEIWYPQQEYEYDDFGRISKISCPMYEDGKIKGVISYDIYTYNAKNQLEKIENYHANLSEGFINLKTYTYSYDKNGNKLKEVIVYPRASPFRTDSTLYHYKNNRLKREDKYEDGYFGKEPWRSELTTYIEYEYDKQGLLVKETYYSGTDNTPIKFSVHSYQNGLNVKTEVFIYYNIIGKTELREIRRYYDKNDNLIYLESEELSMFSSMMSCVSKYEYE